VLIIAAGVSAAGAMPCAAEPLASRDSEVRAGTEAATPIGWTDFCRRYYGECDGRELKAVDIRWTDKAWNDLQAVNDMVNQAIAPMSDLAHWNVQEKWDYPSDGRGDCEDYVLLKRKLLIAHGYPRQALLITVVYRPEDEEGHAVLMAKTDRGDLILDNRRPGILHWSDTGYHFIKRQSQESESRWILLDSPAPAPVAVSAPAEENSH
jgi:predicted transglutaminase-like cysteine proteinase